MAKGRRTSNTKTKRRQKCITIAKR
jgi:hypothetical protein